MRGGNRFDRRAFLRGAIAATCGMVGAKAEDKPSGQNSDVNVLNPLGRVPVSLIIDDSTCLVNLAHFCIPQFAAVFPDRYRQDWRKLPREIPDAFVQKFFSWCREHGVKGKYSVVPCPACVGWLDRELPGWSRAEVDASIKLVHELVTPDWDIHPEMVTHTWVIDIRTGRPYPERSERFMENWGWSQDKSVDELAVYMSYALRILKNVGFRCEGITTPGGFGSRNRVNLAAASFEACRDVFGAEVPHYFRDLYTDQRSVAPQVKRIDGGRGGQWVVSVIGCTGDWFGGWDGLSPGSADRFITEDLQSGRLVEVIERQEPAIMVCHWPGIYFNGQEVGFKILQKVVERLHRRYDHLIWMNLSEIARYWAAKELTQIRRNGRSVELSAPVGSKRFTVQIKNCEQARPRLWVEGREVPLQQVPRLGQLKSGHWCRDGRDVIAAFDLPKGQSRLLL